MKRVVILVNKDFEYKGFVEGLRDTVPVYAGTNGRDAECRFNNLLVDIYCIQHLFNEGENSSNSEVKYNYLSELFKSNEFRLEDVDGIYSVSTSESTPIGQGKDGTESRNGCVYLGSKFFLSDQSKNDDGTESHLEVGSSNTDFSEFHVESEVHHGVFLTLRSDEMKFKEAPLNPAEKTCHIYDENSACIGVVNVMDYSRYKYADKSAYDMFLKQRLENITYGSPIGIETTHGVVVKALKETCSELKLKDKRNRDKNIPVNFISPIVDRYLHFDEDVDGMYGKQNFVCSYNGGVVTGHILKWINVWSH